MNYWETTLEKIRLLIQDGMVQEAMSMIQEELSMPYLDPDFEKEIKKLQEEIQMEMPESSSKMLELTHEEVVSYLRGSLEQMQIAVSYLQKQNIRQWIRELQDYFNEPSCDALIRGALISILIDQQVQTPMTIYEDGRANHFIPSDLTQPNESQAVKDSYQWVHEWFGSDEPSVVELCNMVIIEEAYRRLPNIWKETEAKDIAYLVSQYVFACWDRKEDFQEYCRKNHLEEVSGCLFVEKKRNMGIIN